MNPNSNLQDRHRRQSESLDDSFAPDQKRRRVNVSSNSQVHQASELISFLQPEEHHSALDDDKYFLLRLRWLFLRAKLADRWFSQLVFAHHFISNNQNDNDPKIRVAILDSGIDQTHTDIKNNLSHPGEIKSIHAWKGFPSSLDPLQDPTGHGTHGASVLLKAAPHSELYVARITDDNGEIPSEGNFISILKVVPASFLLLIKGDWVGHWRRGWHNLYFLGNLWRHPIYNKDHRQGLSSRHCCSCLSVKRRRDRLYNFSSSFEKCVLYWSCPWKGICIKF